MITIARTLRPSVLLACLAPALLSTTAAATTYVVDINGGAGVDFTQITDAIAAASPGDVLIVHPGAYQSFTLSIGLSIVGQAGVSAPAVQITNVPSGARAAIASLAFQTVAVSGCNA